jgi:hypothetical protein
VKSKRGVKSESLLVVTVFEVVLGDVFPSLATPPCSGGGHATKIISMHSSAAFQFIDLGLRVN